MILVREIWSVDVDNIDLTSHRGGRILRGVIVRAEWRLVGVPRRITVGGGGDRRIAKDRVRVSREQIAPIDALGRKHGIVEGVILVRHVQLVESTAVMSEEQRRPTHADALRSGRDPERRVSRGQQEVGRRRRPHHVRRWRRTASQSYNQRKPDRSAADRPWSSNARWVGQPISSPPSRQ